MDSVLSLALNYIGIAIPWSRGPFQAVTYESVPEEKHHGPEYMTRLRRFASGVINSKGGENVTQTMRRLTRHVRLVFDYLRMAENSCAGRSGNWAALQNSLKLRSGPRPPIPPSGIGAAPSRSFG